MNHVFKQYCTMNHGSGPSPVVNPSVLNCVVCPNDVVALSTHSS